MDLSLSLFGQSLKNPLIAASGCYGFGREAADYSNLSDWGAVCSKGLTLLPRLGNPAPRVCETPSGMLNSVGLQNPGIDAFLRNDFVFMRSSGVPLILNLAGNSPEDFALLCEKADLPGVLAIELNLSCPNVTSGGMLIGSHPEQIYQVLQASKAATSKPLIAKLTPNVSDITECARAAEEGGADAVSLVNTFLAMAVDIRTKRPILRHNTGGLSGPAIKPIALRMCAELYRSVQIPIIAMGGIQNGEDVLEYILAGASAVELGMVNFIRPFAAREIAQECLKLADELKINSWDSWRGSLSYWNN